MTKIVKSLGLFAFVCSAAVSAQVSHVSINSRMFELGAYPKMRVNVISDSQDMTRLEFALHQSTGEEKLMVEQLNRFLVLLTGVEDVTDPKARLLVREYRVDRWYEVKSVPLFDITGSAQPSVSAAKMAVVKPAKATKAEANKPTINTMASGDNTTVVKASKIVTEVNLVTVEAEVEPIVVAAVTESPVVPRSSGFIFPGDKPETEISQKANAPVSPKEAPSSTKASSNVNAADPDRIDTSNLLTTDAPKPTPEPAVTVKSNAASVEECHLDYNNETLWRIANRYALEWQVSVYGAMLAIHDANPSAFAKNRINALKKNATLDCPAAEIVARYTNAQAAKATFEDRQAGK